jgi:chromosome partitioning protein
MLSPTPMGGKPPTAANDDRRDAQSEGRRCQDDARAASGWPMGRQGKRITLIDADSQGSVLDWSEQRARRRFDRLFGVIGLARDTLHREAPELARHSDHIVIDGPPRVAALLRSALLAADLALIPAQPSPFDRRASAEMLALIAEARLFRPALGARFVLNRCPARTIITRDTVRRLVDQDLPALAACIDQRASSSRSRRSSASSCWSTTIAVSPREIAAVLSEIEGRRRDQARP